jgi:2-polyprenyl-3-methyl-5-hydroxy-6-metoxy-1,4-benzoquinol methylase
MTDYKEIKEKWEKDTTTNKFRHIEVDEKQLNDVYKRFVTDVVDCKDKTIIDYGIGGGWLGKRLLSLGIKKYIGFDICQQSIEFAKDNLKDFENKRIIEVKDIPDFKRYKADVFVSLACVQHFPDIDYVNEWVRKLNDSGINDIIIQYRYNKENKIKIWSKGVQTFACELPLKYITDRMSNYNNWGRFKLNFNGTLVEYTYYKLKV